MARVFQVNGADHKYLTDVDWQDQLDPGGLDGNSATLRYRRLVVRGSIMPMADYVSLKALEGLFVSVTCPPYGDRNGDYISYFGAILETVNGRHDAINMSDVTLEIVVRI